MVNPSLLRLKMEDLMVQSQIYFNHGPRHQLHRLIAQLDNQQIEVYKLIIRVEKKYHKKTDLTALNTEHEVMRGLWNVYYKQGYLHYKNHRKELSNGDACQRFACINGMVDEIGRMIGAWIAHEATAARAV